MKDEIFTGAVFWTGLIMLIFSLGVFNNADKFNKVLMETVNQKLEKIEQETADFYANYIKLTDLEKRLQKAENKKRPR